MIFSQKYRGVRVAIFPVYSRMGLDSARDRTDRREGSNLICIFILLLIIIIIIYLISFSKSVVCVYIRSLLYVFLCLCISAILCIYNFYLASFVAWFKLLRCQGPKRSSPLARLHCQIVQL